MIPSIVITLHVVAGHLVSTPIHVPHVMSAARYHQLYGSASIINWAPAIAVAVLSAAIATSVVVVSTALTRLWARTS